MLKFAKIKYILGVIPAIFSVVACATVEPEPVITQAPQETVAEPETVAVDFNKFIGKVTIASKTPSVIVYEYQDVRIDEVALLAAVYCQDNGNRNAYLEKINLYRNNKRRATFYCSSK